MHQQLVLLSIAVNLAFLCACYNQATEADVPQATPKTIPEERERYDTIVVGINDTLSTTTIYIAYDSFYIIINKWQNNEWVEYQRLDTLTCNFTGHAPKIMDINGDGYQDVRIYKMDGARGGNQYAYVYLYDKPTGQYRYLKGSEAMPNLAYNPKKKMIEGLGYTASLNYVWFKMINDSLIEVSSLERVSWEKDGTLWAFEYHFLVDDTGGNLLIKVDSFKGVDVFDSNSLEVTDHF
jgi:hypothetical protein